MIFEWPATLAPLSSKCGFIHPLFFLYQLLPFVRHLRPCLYRAPMLWNASCISCGQVNPKQLEGINIQPNDVVFDLDLFLFFSVISVFTCCSSRAEVGFGIFLDGQNMSSTELADQSSEKALLVDNVDIFVVTLSPLTIRHGFGNLSLCIVISIYSSCTSGSCASAPGVAKRPDFRAVRWACQVRGVVQLVWNVSVCSCTFLKFCDCFSNIFSSLAFGSETGCSDSVFAKLR